MVSASESAYIVPEVLNNAALKQRGIASIESLFTEPAPVEVGQKFLRIQLCPQSAALLPVDQIAAVIPIAITDILPVPHMPDCVLGIYNWRGELLWLIDLADQIGFPSLLQGGHLAPLMAVVVQVNGQFLGLCVSQIHDIEQHDPQQFHRPLAGLFSPQFLPFVKGYLTGDRVAVLDTAAILQDPLLQVHQLS
jgi:positive phototaxis protein PixI